MIDTLYLPFDTETGGLTPESSLLTAHFAVCDKDFNVIDELGLAMKPNDGQYNVSCEALEINKIDLIAHDKVAKTYSEAGQDLRNFLWKYSKNGQIKLVPVGKNVGFDVIKVTDNLLGRKTWNQFVSYRLYDITGMVMMMKRTGRLAQDAPDSLEGLAKFIGHDFVAHTAKGDNYAGIAVVKWLESLVNL